MFCKNCGNQLGQNQAICLKCGVSTGQGNAFCANCSSPVQPNAAFCRTCGIKIGKVKDLTQAKPIFCKNCGKQMMSVQDICLTCGSLANMGNAFCATCGRPIQPGQVICMGCGTAVKGGSKGGSFSSELSTPLGKKSIFEIGNAVFYFIFLILLFFPMISGGMAPIDIGGYGNLGDYSGLFGTGSVLFNGFLPNYGYDDLSSYIQGATGAVGHMGYACLGHFFMIGQPFLAILLILFLILIVAYYSFMFVPALRTYFDKCRTAIPAITIVWFILYFIMVLVGQGASAYATAPGFWLLFSFMILFIGLNVFDIIRTYRKK